MKIRTDKRTGLKFADYMLGGKRRRVSLGTRNQQVAILKAAKLIEDSAEKDTASMPFAIFWEKYLNKIKVSLRAPSVANMVQLKKKIDAFGAPKLLADITPKYVDNFQTWLVNSNHQSKNSANNMLMRFKAMISQAEIWGLTSVSLRKVKNFKTDNERVEFHTNDELREIMRIAPSFVWQVLVHFGARTGLRKSEFDRLKWQDIEFISDKAADVYVSGQSKSHNFRIVPIRDAELIKKLKRLKATSKESNVFGQITHCINFGCAYAGWASKSGYHCFLHKLRHTFASQLAQKDTPIQKIQKLMGHASITTTMKYAHLLPTDLASNVEKLDQL